MIVILIFAVSCFSGMNVIHSPVGLANVVAKESLPMTFDNDYAI